MSPIVAVAIAVSITPPPLVIASKIKYSVLDASI